MLEPRKLLGDFLDARVPGTESTVGETATKATGLARENPMAAAALAALLLGTGKGRALTGSVLKIGGLAAATLTTLFVLPAVFALVMGGAGRASASVDPFDPASPHHVPGFDPHAPAREAPHAS